MLGRVRVVAVFSIVLAMFFVSSSEASIVVGQAGTGGVTAVIAPPSNEVGVLTNIYMGAMLDGALFMRNGGSGSGVGEWAAYTTGALPIAVANLTLAADSQTIPVINVDLAALPGLAIYVGYGASEADLYSPGHLALIYTVPAAAAVAGSMPYAITVLDVSGNCTLYSSPFGSVLTPTAQSGVYSTIFVGGDSITLTVPGSNTFDYSYAENGGTVSDHFQMTFDSQSRSISGSSTWTHTNGCYGYSTISGTW